MHNKKEGGLSKQGEQKSNLILLKLKKRVCHKQVGKLM